MNWHKDFLGMRIEVFPAPKMRLYGNFTIWYSEKNGGAVLKGSRSWTKINGFMIRTRNSPSFSFQFRRVSK
jgi:hypothetical protein